VDIVCPAGKDITVVAPTFGTAKCTLHIPPQAGLGGVTFKGVGAGTTKGVVVELNTTGVNYAQTKGTAESGNCETWDGTSTGAYVGKAIVTAEEDRESETIHIGLFFS
jgi:hypothetical protein